MIKLIFRVVEFLIAIGVLFYIRLACSRLLVSGAREERRREGAKRAKEKTRNTGEKRLISVLSRLYLS